MATNLTSSAPYCDGTTFIKIVDANAIADLVLDDGTREASPATHANVTQALLRASGEVEMACQVGKKYSPTDLSGLEGAAQAALQGLVADLAFWHLLKRRYPMVEPTEAYKSAMETLERLRLGERIFGTEENSDAGLPNTTFRTQQEIDDLNLNTTMGRRFWGKRGKERRFD